MSELQHNTPDAVADLIQDIIQGKVVCDVGCGPGDFMLAMSKYAREVIGIEEKPELADLARDKNFDVSTHNVFFEPLPPANVYYIWTKDVMGIYLKAKHEGTKGTFILGHSIRPSTYKFLESLNAETRSVKGFKVYIIRE